MPYSVQICVNLLPIGTYFCVIGLLHAGGRPLVTTAVRDFLALAVALAGPVINGPLALLLRSRLLPDFVPHGWWLGVAIYLLAVASLVPSQSTVIVYNTSAQAVTEAVRQILERMGLCYREVPGGWMLSERGLSIELEPFELMSNVSLHLRGMADRDLFRALRDGLAERLASSRETRPRVGLLLASAGGLLLAFPIWMLARDPQAIAALLRAVLDTR